MENSFVSLTLIGRLNCDLFFQFCEWKNAEHPASHVMVKGLKTSLK